MIIYDADNKLIGRPTRELTKEERRMLIYYDVIRAKKKNK